MKYSLEEYKKAFELACATIVINDKSIPDKHELLKNAVENIEHSFLKQAVIFLREKERMV